MTDEVKSRQVQADWLMVDVLGIEITLTREMEDGLVMHAKEFLASGGRISWERWAMLGPASRAAIREAADELKIRTVLEQ